MPSPLTWPVDPIIVLGVEVGAILYVWGGRSARAARRPWGERQWRELAFFSGLAAILVALTGPVELLARQLFWAHMTQHLLLMMVAAPLLVVAAPGLRVYRGLPLRIRRPLAKAVVRHGIGLPLRKLAALLGRPVTAWTLFITDLWLWHVPAMYDLTLGNHLIHHLEHVSFLGFGLLFWAQVIDQPPFRSRLTQMQRAVYVFTATIASWALALVLAFASVPFYAYALLPDRPGGISALTDQQIGAGIMWVPGSVTLAIVLIACLMLWLRDEERVVWPA